MYLDVTAALDFAGEITMLFPPCRSDLEAAVSSCAALAGRAFAGGEHKKATFAKPASYVSNTGKKSEQSKQPGLTGSRRTGDR